MRVFISDKDYEIAKNNGIDKQRVYMRVNTLYWDIEKAITTPIIKKCGNIVSAYKDIPDFDKKLKENGISICLFNNRVNMGWSIEDAYTIKTGIYKDYKKKIKYKKVLKEEVI